MRHPIALLLVIMPLFFSAADSAGSFAGFPNIRLKSGVTGLCSHLIQPAGFSCSEHSTETKDGYVLGLQRVGSGSGIVNGELVPPFFSFTSFYGFLDWSWQELALYDLAEMTRYVYSITNSKVSIVGHSQGTIISLAALTQPNIVEMVEAAALLCPISYLDHMTSTFVLRMVKMYLDEVILALGVHELNFKSVLATRIMDMMCDGHVNCDDMLSAITGKDCCFNSSRIDLYLDYEPHPSSTKNLIHLFQMIRKGTFAKYDYGRWKNLILYGQRNPPEFDLSEIPQSLPLWMGYGGNDALADVADVEHTLRELKGKPDVLYLGDYGHIDFILSVRSKEDVYDSMVGFLKSLQKASNL
ncbi:hypothetical protein DM860_015179 [Cuscuta australis]|uniref:Uncharacterized protein n=1 Tax=Cuscuta australis TaxID=267555 RepID=A0A328D2L8_9ASTE|nr:hypothetical protein DM860_015179 [Cuscuta australis]